MMPNFNGPLKSVQLLLLASLVLSVSVSKLVVLKEHP
jgi:hypothetical protein